MTDYAAIFDALSESQLEVLGAISIGADREVAMRRVTLGALTRKGLIEVTEQTIPGRFPIVVKRYEMALPVHIAWCQWCSDNYDDDGNRLPREGGAE